MEKEENKLFKFATKELSQDAFICWCINWINYKKEVKGDKKKENLYKMATQILDKILENADINSKDIEKVNIIRQFENIDITLTITTNKSKEQYIVIIEDKVGAKLSNHQKKDLYVSKLTKALETKQEKQDILFLKEFNKNNIIPVFWKTQVWNENKEELKRELTNNIGKKVVCIDGKDTLELLKSYIKYSEVVEDFYNYLQEYLRINNQLENDNYCVNKILENEKLVEGTTFSKNYYAYNCFSKLLGKEYDDKHHPQTGGVVLRKISERLVKENVLNKSNKLKNKDNKKNIVAVDTIRFFTFKTSYKNYLKNNENLWIEEVESKIVDKGEYYTNLRYIFLFARKINAFRREQYEFLGLYKLKKYDEKNRSRIWEKQKAANNTVSLNEEKIIELIKKVEE